MQNGQDGSRLILPSTCNIQKSAISIYSTVGTSTKYLPIQGNVSQAGREPAGPTFPLAAMKNLITETLLRIVDLKKQGSGLHMRLFAGVLLPTLSGKAVVVAVDCGRQGESSLLSTLIEPFPGQCPPLTAMKYYYMC